MNSHGGQLKDATAVKPASGKTVNRFGWLMAGVLVSQGACLPALAGLGGDATTVEADRASMKGQVRVTTAAAGYTVHEIQTPNGTVVHEYVSPAGKVFAVTWKGPLMPDLGQTLGAYAAQYQAAASAPHIGHRHLSVDTSDVVIRSDGHMRLFTGYAYVPSLLPTNLSISDIK
jgi:Protein of unknown function (DUF2844)